MALAFRSATRYISSPRFTIRVPPTTTHTVNQPTASVATRAPTPSRTPVQFDIPYTTIDIFFRTDVTALLHARHDTPSIQLVLDNVPFAAVPTLRAYIESINEHVKIEYNATTKKLIISCASAEHNFMAGIGREIMSIVSANSNSFTANDPSYEIIENGDSGVPLGDEKHGRQPDGGLRLLNTTLPPFLIWEVLDSQPLAAMVEKISHYFTKSRGRIRIVIVIQLIRQRPSGRLIEGFYWVYKHRLNASRNREIICAAERVEFFPALPTGSLTLTWDDIVKTVPQELVGNCVNIPFSILHERFGKMVAAAMGPVVFDDDDDEEEMWEEGAPFPGIQTVVESEEEGEEESGGEDREDADFVGGARGVLLGAAGPRRSQRLASGAGTGGG